MCWKEITTSGCTVGFGQANRSPGSEELIIMQKIKGKAGVAKNTRIGIVGAGIGGCALACALKQRGFVDVKIYEKDKSFSERRQGYGLTIQQAVNSLLELGIQSIFDLDTPSTARYIFAENGDIISFFGRTFYKFVDSKKFNVHLSRQDLRYLLMEPVRQYVSWNKRVADIKVGASVTLQFAPNPPVPLGNANISEEEVDLLVGADGIYSFVRNKLFDSPPLNYLGVIVVLGIVQYDHELLDQVIFESSNGTVRLFCMPFSSHFSTSQSDTKVAPKPPTSCPVAVQTMWQLSFPMAIEKAKELSKNKQDLKMTILEKVKSFHSPVPEMVACTDLENIMGTPVFDFDPLVPDVLRRVSRVTLIGDALHAMSPFKSQGANRAILDAMKLADKLSSSHCDSVESAILSYERAISAKNQEKVMVSRQKVSRLHIPVNRNSHIRRTDVPNHNLTLTLKNLNIGSWTKHLDKKIKDAVVIPAQPRKSKLHSRTPVSGVNRVDSTRISQNCNEPNYFVLCLGDQFMYGDGVKKSKSFPAQLIKKLNKAWKNTPQFAKYHSVAKPSWGVKDVLQNVTNQCSSKHFKDAYNLVVIEIGFNENVPADIFVQDFDSLLQHAISLVQSDGKYRGHVVVLSIPDYFSMHPSRSKTVQMYNECLQTLCKKLDSEELVVYVDLHPSLKSCLDNPEDYFHADNGVFQMKPTAQQYRLWAEAAFASLKKGLA